jgi:hypothetical protein
LAIIVVIIIAAVNAPPAEEKEPVTFENITIDPDNEFQAYNVDFWILNVAPDANIISIAARTDDSDFDSSLARDLGYEAIEFMIKYFKDRGRNLRNNTTISCELLIGEKDGAFDEMWCVGVSVYIPEDNTVVYTEANMTRGDFWANFAN